MSDHPKDENESLIYSNNAHKAHHAELIKAGLDALFAQLQTYLSAEDCTRVRAAFVVADAAHLGQYRQTGEPYITHPIAVATLCANWKLDSQSIMAALLHDVLEDTGVDKITLANEFGATVANLVDGLSKLDKLHFDSKEEQQAESFRKMLVAIAEDVRVIMVKLADRLHNLNTMSTLNLTKRRRIARETLDIYAPIAHRLGLEEIYRQLEDLCFHQTHHLRAAILEKALKRARQHKSGLFGKTLEQVRQSFAQAGLEAETYGREKNLASIYKKMRPTTNDDEKKIKSLPLKNILDLYGFRIIVEKQTDCYLALGVIHGLFECNFERFKDYISCPKPNGYQSLHTTVKGHYGTPIEFQIRTVEMQRTAESGIATHWLYKDKDLSFSEVQKQSHLTLQSLFHIQQKTNDSIEFLEHIKVDLSTDAIYVRTPKSKIITLPRHATALDFAFSIHSNVGMHAVSAQINGIEAALSVELHNGDVVKITTNENATPHSTWNKWVKTDKARNKLRHYFKSQQLTESAQLGEQMFRQALEAINLPFPEMSDKKTWDKLLSDTSCKTQEELLSEIGLDIRPANITAQRLLMVAHSNKEHKAASRIVRTSQHLIKPEVEKLVIRGDESSTLTLSKCCHPIPGDGIVGHLLRRQGLIVHTHNCPTARNQRAHDNLRWIELEWDRNAELADPFPIQLDITCRDGRGVLAQVASTISETGANIETVVSVVSHQEVHIDVIIDVTDRVHLAQVFKSLRALPETKHISRRLGSKPKH